MYVFHLSYSVQCLSLGSGNLLIKDCLCNKILKNCVTVCEDISTVRLKLKKRDKVSGTLTDGCEMFFSKGDEKKVEFFYETPTLYVQ